MTEYVNSKKTINFLVRTLEYIASECFPEDEHFDTYVPEARLHNIKRYAEDAINEVRK